MGLLSSLVSFASLLLRKRDYVEESEEWFDDVWEHIMKPADGEGELKEKNGRIYRQLRVRFRNNFTILITDDDDEGAEKDDVKLGWWKKMSLDYNEIVTIKKLWK